MATAEKDILTTADTAALLGVSVRTAQLLIEGGTITSWKTPGGHRRVYRADVMALIESGGRDSVPPSANLVVIASATRLPVYDQIFAQVPECRIEAFDDPLAALIAIGSLKPHAIIVDVEQPDADRQALLESLAANASVAGSRILIVGPQQSVPPAPPNRMMRYAAAEEVAAAVRASLRDEQPLMLAQSDLPFPIALNEGQRLVALERSGLLDSPPEEAFDRLTWLAAQALDTPIALLTMLTPTRQWFKSRIGVEIDETPRSWAFCNHTIMQKGLFVVDDLAEDPRFAGNPAVAGGPRFRFYAGAPVVDHDGFVIGTLCVIDHRPRTLDERGARTIQALAALASDEVRLRALERKLGHPGRSSRREV